MIEKGKPDFLPTYFWLGKEGSPEMRWVWHNGMVMVISSDGKKVTSEYKIWIKRPMFSEIDKQNNA
jgi:hypothetical protein